MKKAIVPKAPKSRKSPSAQTTSQRVTPTESSSEIKENQVCTILDSLEAIVYVADIQSHEILFANKFTKDLFGEVIGKPCWQALQENQSGPCSFCTNDKLVDHTGKPTGTYNWDYFNSSTARFYDIYDKAIHWTDGRMVRLEIAIDKTDHKQFEEALLKSEEKFHTFADYTYNWEYWIDSEGGFSYMSPSCERATGYKPEDFSNDPHLLLAITHDNDRNKFSAHLKDELNKDKEHHCDFRIISRTGEERWIAHSCQPVFGKDGAYLGRRASNRDITKRKLAEAKVLESEAKLKNIFNNSPTGIAFSSFDKNTSAIEKEKHVLVNPAMQSFFGYTASEIQSKTLEQLSHPEDMKKDLPLLKALQAGTCDNYKIEKRYIKKNGEIVWGNLSRSLIKTEPGSTLGMVSTIEDINERKAAEKALNKAKNELEKKVKERTRELAGANQKLLEEKIKLVEANTALKVLLNRRENDKKNIEQQVLANIKELVDPYLQKLSRGKLSAKHSKYLDIITANLNEITSPFVNSIASKHLNLSPAELQVANLVKQGRSTSEIAGILNLSPETISNHRKKIRKKSGITNKKTNLRTLLSALSD